MVRDCWDFGWGGFKHFPAGTYQVQMERPYGAVELELMRLLHRCWRVLVDTKKDKYGEEEFEFLDWLVADERCERTNGLVLLSWANNGS